MLRTTLIVIAWLTALPALSANDQALAAETDLIVELIRQLDADAFKVRERADRLLTEIGAAALPALERAAHGATPELRHRARRIRFRIEHGALCDQFERLVDLPDERVDLEQGMLLIARIGNPQVCAADVARQLDALADRVRQRLGAGVVPRQADPRQVVEAIRQVVFVDEGFAVNRVDFDNPDNSLLDRVLATKKGLPILISHLIVAVGGRLQLPMVGLQVPSRYMVKYEGSRAPAGFPRDDLVVDPFVDGQVLSAAELPARLGRPIAEDDLLPSPHLKTIARMLRNLQSDYQQAGQMWQAERTSDYLRIVAREEP